MSIYFYSVVVKGLGFKQNELSHSCQKDPCIELYGYHVSTSASKDRKDSCATVLGTEMWIWPTLLLTAKSLALVTRGIKIIYG
jgi:hypothetical protein